MRDPVDVCRSRIQAALEKLNKALLEADKLDLRVVIAENPHKVGHVNQPFELYSMQRPEARR